jgi:NosR/NirI family transcriptional regulator, nitrous oxide reductase regulator
MIRNIQSWIAGRIFSTADGPSRRPLLSKDNESSIKGLYVVGDLAGAPVIKLAMQQGHDVIETIASKHSPDNDSDVLDIIVIGSGAAGLNAALAANDKGYSCIVFEKEKIANTIENFPEGKWVYAEPDDSPPKGKLWLDGATKENLLKRWNQIILDNNIDVHTEEAVESIDKDNGLFQVHTVKGSYTSHYIVLASGQRGNPRKLGIDGEDLEQVYHQLYSPRKYSDEDILVVGGGNSAVEAALTLSEQNKVQLSYRGGEFSRLFKDNRQKVDTAIATGKIKVHFNSTVDNFSPGKATLHVNKGGHDDPIELPAQHSFILIGSELPVKFLKSLGIKLENEWEGSLLRSFILTILTLVGLWFAGGHTGVIPDSLSTITSWSGIILALGAITALITYGRAGDRWSWLGVSFLICYTIYGVKAGKGGEFWPFADWGYQALTFADRPWSFWYTVLYTSFMTVFGVQALKRWGLDRKDRFQIWRYISLIGFQWLFFFIIPEFLFQWAVEFQWVGALANDPQFAEQSWRSYGIVYAWPLFFYTFFYNPHQVWVVWGVVLSFGIIPVFVLFHGKRYCSWICGCGGLAETFGDKWRHLAPKGKNAIKWEWMSGAVLIIATLVTLIMLGKDVYGALAGTAKESLSWYRLAIDIWLVGILPVTLYPFLGGKVWCRYWCPLAKMMQFTSKLYVKLGISRFAIHSNDKCIACNECSRYCQVGIDVMSYALKQDKLDNETSSCIGCGVCVTVCPMDTLSFTLPVIQPQQLAQNKNSVIQ